MDIRFEKRISRCAKFFLRSTYVLNPSRIFRVLRHRIFTPSNKLHIRNLTRDWHDRDVRILHANFSILCDFVEKEYGGLDKLEEDIKYFEDRPAEDNWGAHLPEKKEMVALYKWYNSINWNDYCSDTPEYTKMTERTTLVIGADNSVDLNHPGYTDEEYRRIVMDNAQAEVDFENLCTENAIRILKIRQHLWT